MSREDSPNPYREKTCPGLYAAWEEGYRAYQEGNAVPERHLESPSEASNAWLNGYTAAQLSNQRSAQPGPADPE
jgi:hypothetical protein